MCFFVWLAVVFFFSFQICSTRWRGNLLKIFPNRICRIVAIQLVITQCNKMTDTLAFPHDYYFLHVDTWNVISHFHCQCLFSNLIVFFFFFFLLTSLLYVLLYLVCHLVYLAKSKLCLEEILVQSAPPMQLYHDLQNFNLFGLFGCI